jgi:hypothetical protein
MDHATHAEEVERLLRDGFRPGAHLASDPDDTAVTCPKPRSSNPARLSAVIGVAEVTVEHQMTA